MSRCAKTFKQLESDENVKEIKNVHKCQESGQEMSINLR